MPSKKPQFVIRTEKEVLEKIGYIARENERNSTQEIVYLIKKRIKEYEAEHGEIEIDENEKKKIIINPLNPYGTGYALGDTLAEKYNNKKKQKKE